MAAVDQASSSSSSSTTFSGSSIDYEVFLNFHGNDVRTSFLDHLYNALVRAGIRTFKDSEELHEGNKIGKQLLTSIQESKISIPIFSTNYPSSKWCLLELIQIYDCRETLNRIVMPIFYKVEPRDVRKQTGIYENVFEQYGIDVEPDVLKWKAAMKEVGELKGWHVDEKAYEGQIVEQVVKRVKDELNRGPFSENDNLVGAESHLKKMLKLLEIKSDNKKIIGIQGLGGIGKTTIAKIVYNKVCNHFEACSFIVNVREVARQYNGLALLQQQLLWDTLKYKGRDITIVDAGTRVIHQRLCSKKVLLVLDDVDHEDQVKCLVGDREWFGVGSKIIITTRDERILCFGKADEIYKPRPMNLDDSLQLFGHYAFKRDQPTEDYLELSKAMIKTTGGLPLALQVIGSSLYSKGTTEWKAMLKKLQKVPNNDIIERLKTSFDGLDDEEKQMFLDIACFFIGMYKDIVCYIWEDCGFQPSIGLYSLCEKSLITISEKGVLEMHDVLQDLGRSIVRRENANELGKRTRIWSPEDVSEVLHTQTGTSSVIGLSIDFKNVSKKKGLRSEGFAGMTRLRLLQIDFAESSWNFTNSFSELRWLSWKGCPNQCIETVFYPHKLVVLDLSHSDITADWCGWNYIKMATNLKVLNLSQCRQLSRTPDLSDNLLLEVLHFSGCWKLDEIDKSICCLRKLIILNMEVCHKLRVLPSEISELTDLQRLNLNCTSLQKLPENWGHMVSLRDLRLDFGNQESAADLSVEISQLTALQSLALCSLSPSLKSVSWLPPSLTDLVFESCDSIQNISGLPSNLTSLIVKRCRSVVKVSSTSKGLRKLKTLHLYDCDSLEEIEGCDNKLDILEHISIEGCKSLQKLPNLRGSKYLRTLRIFENDFIFQCKIAHQALTLDFSFSKGLDDHGFASKRNFFGDCYH